MSFFSRAEVGEGCWRWLGAISKQTGYGHYSYRENGRPRSRPAHRVALEISLGRPLGSGKIACHSCDNRWCVNPAHLWEGTYRENMQDAAAKGRMARGARVNTAKLTEDAVVEIRSLQAAGVKTTPLARRFGVAPSTIRRIATRKYWACVQSA